MATVDTTGQTQAGMGLSRYQEMFEQAKRAKDKFTPDMYLNLAFYLGRQWVLWNRASGQLDRPRLAKYRETLTDNRILPNINTRVAKKVSSKPVFVSTPKTGDEDDINAAKIGEKVMQDDWNTLRLRRRLYQAMQLAEVTGAGFWKIYWDRTKGNKRAYLFGPDGQPILSPTTGRPMPAEMAQQLPPEMLEGLTARDIAEGDVAVEVMSPFALFPDPLAIDLETAEWIIEEKVRSPNYVEEHFGKQIEPDAPAPTGPVESRLATSELYGGSGAGEFEGVKVYELSHKPCPKYPQGLRAVWAADQILAEDFAPFDPMPYVMYSSIPAPDRFWPTAITTHLRPLQIELNKLLSQILENAKRVGNPAILTSRQANIEYTGLPGERIEYDSTVQDAVPSYLEAPNVPTYVREQIDRIIESIAEISSIRDVSKATVPSGVTAASAINLLQEAANTVIGPEVDDMGLALGIGGSKILALRAQFNTDERLLRIAGDDGDWDITAFRGAMLRDNTTIEVQPGSAMPQSQAAKQAAMYEHLSLLMQYGIQLDPRDLRQFFKDYEVGGLERLFANLGRDEQQTNREHRIMLNGQPLPTNEFDNDEFHIAAHEDFQKSDRYTKLPPEHQQIFVQHVTMHRQRVIETTNMQIAQQQREAMQMQQMALSFEQQKEASNGDRNQGA
jgi:hypothetical protein